jgi:AcrR family transcriptional regulator
MSRRIVSSRTIVEDVPSTKPSPLASRRNESSRLAILDAALSLCREKSYAKVSVEAIAARAGVGKQTIYRWWPSKGAVLLDALEGVAAGVPTADTGDVLADMRTRLAQVVDLYADESFGPLLAALIGEAQHDPSLHADFLDRYLKPRRAQAVEVLQVAQQNGQLPEDLNLADISDVIFGAVYHRLLLRNGPLNEAYAHFVIDTVLSGFVEKRPRDRTRRTRETGAAGASR